MSLGLENKALIPLSTKGLFVRAKRRLLNLCFPKPRSLDFGVLSKVKKFLLYFAPLKYLQIFGKSINSTPYFFCKIALKKKQSAKNSSNLHSPKIILNVSEKRGQSRWQQSQSGLHGRYFSACLFTAVILRPIHSPSLKKGNSSHSLEIYVLQRRPLFRIRLLLKQRNVKKVCQKVKKDFGLRLFKLDAQISLAPAAKGISHRSVMLLFCVTDLLLFSRRKLFFAYNLGATAGKQLTGKHSIIADI